MFTSKKDPRIGACLADAGLKVITVGWLFEKAGWLAVILAWTVSSVGLFRASI